jgi:AmiR/NasT family two-component response regulator
MTPKDAWHIIDAMRENVKELRSHVNRVKDVQRAKLSGILMSEHVMDDKGRIKT